MPSLCNADANALVLMLLRSSISIDRRKGLFGISLRACCRRSIVSSPLLEFSSTSTGDFSWVSVPPLPVVTAASSHLSARKATGRPAGKQQVSFRRYVIARMIVLHGNRSGPAPSPNGSSFEQTPHGIDGRQGQTRRRRLRGPQHSSIGVLSGSVFGPASRL